MTVISHCSLIWALSPKKMTGCKCFPKYTTDFSIKRFQSDSFSSRYCQWRTPKLKNMRYDKQCLCSLQILSIRPHPLFLYACPYCSPGTEGEFSDAADHKDCSVPHDISDRHCGLGCPHQVHAGLKLLQAERSPQYIYRLVTVKGSTHTVVFVVDIVVVEPVSYLQ